MRINLHDVQQSCFDLTYDGADQDLSHFDLRRCILNVHFPRWNSLGF